MWHLHFTTLRGKMQVFKTKKEKRLPENRQPPLFVNFNYLLLHSIDADLFAGLAKAFKLHFAVHERKERVVGAFADVVARMDVGAALLDKNVAGKHELTVCAFHAESFGFGITAVTGGTHTFFMREKLDVHFKHCCCTSEF